jgi:hypothetical protein
LPDAGGGFCARILESISRLGCRRELPLCSGGVPPHSVRKCKLVFDFDKPQSSIRVEAKGLGEESAFFALGK